MPDFSIIVAHRPHEAPVLTPQLLDDLGWQDAELVHVAGNLPSYQRNRAAAAARGRYLYFLDDDSLPDPGNLDRLREIFAVRDDAAAAGGPSLTPAGDGVQQHAFGHVLGSFWGSAWMRSRYHRSGNRRETDDRELILCNLAFRRDRFLESGGFDTTLYPNEENDLLDRLRDRGWVLIHDPDITVGRSQRPSFRAFCRQLFGYGRGRAEQLRRNFRPANLPLFVFLGFPLYLLALPLLLTLAPWTAIPLGLHWGLDLLASLPLCCRRPTAFLLAVPAFFLCHLLYGAGMWRGLCGRFRSAVRVSVPEARVRIHPPRRRR